MKETDGIFHDLPTILLHPQTAIHEIKQTGANDDVLMISISFTAPFEADFASDEYDASPKTVLTPKELRLLGALAHSESVEVCVENMSRTATTLCGVAVIEARRKPNWGKAFRNL